MYISNLLAPIQTISHDQQFNPEFNEESRTNPNRITKINNRPDDVLRLDQGTYDLISNNMVPISIEDFVRDYVTQIFPEARDHITKISNRVIKMLERLHGVENSSKRDVIRKRGIDNYQSDISPLKNLLINKFLRVN